LESTYALRIGKLLKACEHALMYVKEWLRTTPMVKTPPLSAFIQSIEQQVGKFQHQFGTVNIIGQVPFDMQQLDLN